jgi:hypothetical protein
MVPKTLIFAKDDSHADDIVQIVREEFGEGNDFCEKITYRTRINKLHAQARSRLAELEGRRAVSAQFEPMAEKVTQYCALTRDRLNDLSFAQKREVLEALQAQFTLEKDGNLRILLVLPTSDDVP